MANADRQHRRRERKRLGRVVLAVEVDLAAVRDLLLEERVLGEWDDANREAIRAALDTYVAIKATYR